MAGIYLHIPFCRQACHYCNFHFSTLLRERSALVDALILEAEMRREEWLSLGQQTPGGSPPVADSLYFGGGTPSVLEASDLERLFNALYRIFPIGDHAEVTLECNPDDLTPEHLRTLRDSPVNRLSIGIQSFSDEELQAMNRAHNSDQALRCLDDARALGFEQLNVDLIYGSPGQSSARWKANLREIFRREIPHLSTYALTVEEGTALAHQVRRGTAAAPDESTASAYFDLLQEEAYQAGYTHYEISNLCRKGAFARHNSRYWSGQPYLGLGPSAHSFNGRDRRSWNVANNALYRKALNEGQLPVESEQLSSTDQWNERIMTRLRTTWGLDLQQLTADFGSAPVEWLREQAAPWLNSGQLRQTHEVFWLSRKGRPYADRIASDLFLLPEQGMVCSPAFTGNTPETALTDRKRYWETEERPG